MEYQLTVFKNVEKFSDIPKFKKNSNSKVLDMNKVVFFVNENRSTILTVCAGIAEDWRSTQGGIYFCDYGFMPHWSFGNRVASKWGTPAISVFFIDGDILEFVCYYEEKTFIEKIVYKLNRIFKKWR